MDDKLKAIGSRIKAERNKKKITQASLAEMAHISPQHMSDIENGKKACRIDILINIIEALNVSADYLLCTNTDGAAKFYTEEMESFLKECTEEEKGAYLEIIKKIQDTFNKN